MARPKKNSQKNNPAELQNAKDKLIESYLALAYEKGVSQITIQMIADRAGVAFGTVRYYFDGESEKIEFSALKYLIQKAYVYLEETIFKDRNQPGFDPIRSYVKNMLQWIHAYPAHASFLSYYYYLCSTKSETPIPNQLFLQRSYLRIESFLNEAVGQGLYPQLENKNLLSKIIHSAILGASMTVGTIQKEETLKEQIDICQSHVQALIKSFHQ